VDAPAIRVAGIRKVYGTTVAVADVSFEVEPGEIFGLIGPNGAGKTTTMECVGGLRAPDAGTISVLGLDPVRDIRALQQRVGVQLQQAQLQKRIKVWEAVDLWASLYPHHVDGEQLLARLGLADKRNAWFMTLSGGQKQRLFIALALIHDPDVVLLDELTTGLDPQARRAIWDMVRGIRARQDGAADDAPDGRGREAVRPRGHHRARHGGGHRNAGRPGAAVLPRAGRRADHGRRPGA
jgi:ABC-2 type transport system ATP-binding protein